MGRARLRLAAVAIMAGAATLLPACSRPGALSRPSDQASEPSSAKQQSPGVAPQSRSIAEMETTVRQRINEIRRKRDLKPLEENEKLARLARAYSRRMAQKGFFSHTDPSGETAVDRARSADLSFALLGENIFKSVNAPDPVKLAVQGWMDSPGHRKNILRPGFTQTGVGIWREGKTYHYTQLFMRPL